MQVYCLSNTTAMLIIIYHFTLATIKRDNCNNNDATSMPAQRSITLSASDLFPHARGRGRRQRQTFKANRCRSVVFDWNNTLVAPQTTETTTTNDNEGNSNNNFKITIDNKDIKDIGNANTAHPLLRKRANSL